MKKFIKVVCICIIYAFIFWGLMVGIQKLIKHDKNTNQTETVKEVTEDIVIEEPVEENKQEEKIVEEEKVIEEKKEKPTKQTKTVSTTKVAGTKAEYQAYAHDLVINTYGWTEEDYQALVKLWTKESDWNPNSHNKSSGAHGIPQSLPANKMASEGDDYYTNGYTQIRWGLKYIKQRYGTPSKAWQHFQNKNWY